METRGVRKPRFYSPSSFSQRMQTTVKSLFSGLLLHLSLCKRISISSAHQPLLFHVNVLCWKYRNYLVSIFNFNDQLAKWLWANYSLWDMTTHKIRGPALRSIPQDSVLESKLDSITPLSNFLINYIPWNYLTLMYSHTGVAPYQIAPYNNSQQNESHVFSKCLDPMGSGWYPGALCTVLHRPSVLGRQNCTFPLKLVLSLSDKQTAG